MRLPSPPNSLGIIVMILISRSLLPMVKSLTIVTHKDHLLTMNLLEVHPVPILTLTPMLATDPSTATEISIISINRMEEIFLITSNNSMERIYLMPVLTIGQALLFPLMTFRMLDLGPTQWNTTSKNGQQV